MTALPKEILRTGFLEICAANLTAWNLRCNRQHRDTAALAIIESVDQMQIAGTAASCADSKISGEVGLSSCSEGRDLLVSYVNPLHLPLSPNRIGETVERIPGKAVNSFHPRYGQGLH